MIPVTCVSAQLSRSGRDEMNLETHLNDLRSLIFIDGIKGMTFKRSSGGI